MFSVPEGAATTVARFEIPYYRWLAPDGTALVPPPAWATPEKIKSLLGWMAKTRAVDKKAVSLQRTGRLGTYASGLGQEAVGAALGDAMAADDVLIPAYRDYAAQFIRGVPPERVLAYWAGHPAGLDWNDLGDVPAQHDFGFAVPIGTQVPHGIGVAYAFKARKQPRVAVSCCGDGATSKGDVYEAISSAALWKLPLVFFVVNNGWAISLPRSRQTGAETLAQKAIAGGIPGVQVDGNDLIATREILGQALAHARSGQGPMLIEAVTYRLHDHTTADDARRYRDASELEEAVKNDPIARLKAWLKGQGAWTDAEDATLEAEAAAYAEGAAERYMNLAPPDPAGMFDHLYARLPASLKGQREEMLSYAAGALKGGH